VHQQTGGQQWPVASGNRAAAQQVRKVGPVLSRSSLIRVIVLGTLFSLVALPRTAEPATAAVANRLPDGVWIVQGRRISGMRCGDWMVRLTNAQDRLSGVVSLARSSVPLQNLAVSPGGSFSGTAPARVVGTTHVRGYRVTGRFSGDRVDLTLQDNICPPRHGTATRQARG
jgi:hypothetical protein